MAGTAPESSQLPREFPLVGRSSELERLFTVFGTDGDGSRLRLISGESGVGKTRLAQTVAGEARRRDWQVVHGRAYPVEQGVPYALLADAFVPLLREVEPSRLTVLSRGREVDLLHLFPALGSGDLPRDEGLEPEELRTRLFWTFNSVLTGLARQEPMIVFLEDLQWADASSIALIHFLVRNLDGDQVRLVASYTSEEKQRSPGLIQMEHSLAALDRIERHDVRPLDLAAIVELLGVTFRASGPHVREFAERLYGWTRGNAYFVEHTLRALVQQGQLYRQEGTWLGWESQELSLPSTVRDAILSRFQGLEPVTREIAEIMAVVGRPTRAVLLERVLARDRAEISRAVEQLVHRALIEEVERDREVWLQFHHPLTRETLYRGLALTRKRLLHENVAGALESIHGDHAEEHADEIAYHLTRYPSRAVGARAVRYLARAGKDALRRHADEEAAAYLDAALTALAQDEADADSRELRLRVTRRLARAQTRLGRYDKATHQWDAILSAAEEADDRIGQADALRNLGLLAFWAGHNSVALERFEAARWTLPEGADELRAYIELAAGMAYQQLGRAHDSRERILEALRFAEAVGKPGLRARVHRALALVSTWLGETSDAREHGQKAVQLAAEARDKTIVFWGQWGLAFLEGLLGGPRPMKPLLDQLRQTANEIGSPVLTLSVDELALEYACFTGDWDAALALGSKAAHKARALNQRAILVRILVWTSTVYMNRSDLEKARELIDEATALSDTSETASSDSQDVHTVVPAIIGRTALLLAEERYEEAVEVGNGGLAIAEASGYINWVVHRLLPLVGEAYIRMLDLESARKVLERLRHVGERMQHKLSLVWATACEALITWHGGAHTTEAAARLRAAAEEMEEIGITYEAARLRRQLAGRLAELGDRDEALAQLRGVHEVFKRLGAKAEYEFARVMFDEIDARRPVAWTPGGTDGLSAREYETAALVADEASNKEIAARLDIKVRTVTTHLTNIYKKLGLEGSALQKRLKLGQMIREGRLQRPDS